MITQQAAYKAQTTIRRQITERTKKRLSEDNYAENPNGSVVKKARLLDRGKNGSNMQQNHSSIDEEDSPDERRKARRENLKTMHILKKRNIQDFHNDNNEEYKE